MSEEEISHCVRIGLAMADMTPQDLATVLCISNATAYSYTQGKIPTIKKLSEVAAALAINYEDFLKLSKNAKVGALTYEAE